MRCQPDPDVLVTYIQNKNLSDAARKQLEQIATQKRQIAEMDNEIRRTDASVNELVRDQDRMRSNIASLNQVSGQQQLLQTYARQLSAQESQIATLRDGSYKVVRVNINFGNAGARGRRRFTNSKLRVWN